MACDDSRLSEAREMVSKLFFPNVLLESHVEEEGARRFLTIIKSFFPVIAFSFVLIVVSCTIFVLITGSVGSVDEVDVRSIRSFSFFDTHLLAI